MCVWLLLEVLRFSVRTLILGPLLSMTLALWLVTPAVTAMVLGCLVSVMTRVLCLRRPVPSILRGTPVPCSRFERHLEALTEAALISIGRLCRR